MTLHMPSELSAETVSQFYDSLSKPVAKENMPVMLVFMDVVRPMEKDLVDDIVLKLRMLHLIPVGVTNERRQISFCSDIPNYPCSATS